MQENQEKVTMLGIFNRLGILEQKSDDFARSIVSLEERIKQTATKEDLAQLEARIWRALWQQNVFMVVTIGGTLVGLFSL